MTKVQVKGAFDEYVKPCVIAQHGKDDKPAIREAWNNYTDSLCKDGFITPHQYDTWSGPYN